MPFWSLRSRAERIISAVPAYDGFEVVPVPLDEWRGRWLSGRGRDRLRVGLNWSGESATGHDLAPNEVAQNLVHGGPVSARSRRDPQDRAKERGHWLGNSVVT